MRDLPSAIRFAKEQVGLQEWNRMCQGLARTAIGVPPFGKSASIAWETCRERGWGVPVDNDTVIPAGSIVYYSATVKFKGHDPTVGHATFCVKSGGVDSAVVVSNDVGSGKEVGAVRPEWFKLHWSMGVRGYIIKCPYGRLPIEDGVGDFSPDAQDATQSGPGVRLSNLVPGASGPDVSELQRALIDQGFDIPAGVTGNYLEQTVAAVMAAQEIQGLVGSDADGAVGRKTCLFLGLEVVDDEFVFQPKDMPSFVLPQVSDTDLMDDAEF
jgi:hypothetical protein